ncbi:hypothetical protein DRQ07_00355 [candidate division KSB1 bacterium]|nr:MAG: hypothetical protein DRQ07_00355 [candidate division KSB1 bacterium]
MNLKIDKKSKLWFYIPVIIVIFVASALLIKSFPVEISVTEMLFGQISIVLIYLLSFNRVWLLRMNLFHRFVLFGFTLFVLYTLIDRTLYSVTYESTKFSDVSRVYIPALVLIMIISWFVFILIKSLVFMQQSKTTLRNFRILLFLIIARVIAVLADGSDFVNNVDLQNNFFNTSPINIALGMFEPESFFIFLIVSLIIMNSFRVKWIHYLNKRDKILSLFAFFIFTVLSARIVYNSQSVFNMSNITGVFLHSAALFSLIYSLMSFTGILFLLPSAGILDKRIREVKSFQQLSSTVSSIFEPDALCEKAVELAAQISGSNVVWIELKQGDDFRITASKGLNADRINLLSKECRKIHDRLQHNKSLIINDCRRERLTKDFVKKWFKECSLIAVKLVYKDKYIGHVFGLKYIRYGYTDEIRALFEAFAYQISMALENADLVKLTIEQQIYREELRVAHEAQMRLLPGSKPDNKTADIDGFCMTANEIGGDLYDFICVNDDRIDILVGDVSGKGASSAFYMAELKGVLLALSRYVDSPTEIMVQANNFVRQSLEKNMFATMVYCIFIPSKKVLHFARAGHPPVMLIRNGKVEPVDSSGLGLGMADEDDFSKFLSVNKIKLRKNDAVVIYTDGITEARDRHGNEFGEERLVELLAKCSDFNTEQIIETIKKEISDFSKGTHRHDDATAVVMKIL